MQKSIVSFSNSTVLSVYSLADFLVNMISSAALCSLRAFTTRTWSTFIAIRNGARASYVVLVVRSLLGFSSQKMPPAAFEKARQSSSVVAFISLFLRLSSMIPIHNHHW